MLICICNRKYKEFEMYDVLIDISNLSNSLYLKNWIVSEDGLCNDQEALNKDDLQKNYLKGINQIVSNDSNTNYTYETPTGEVIEFVGIGNHLEKQIGEEIINEEKQIKF